MHTWLHVGIKRSHYTRDNALSGDMILSLSRVVNTGVDHTYLDLALAAALAAQDRSLAL